MARFFCPQTLSTGLSLALPANAARHVQVLRLQPGDAITLFNGEGGEWRARIERMGRSDVAVVVEEHQPEDRMPVRAVHLALGMPANDRMDWLVEKATELGVASIQPLHTARSVLRLTGERAAKKQAHWTAVAVAASEQCGGNRVPVVHPVRDLADWLSRERPAEALRCVLSLASGARPLAQVLQGPVRNAPVAFLCGPEGGLTSDEDALARAAGCQPVALGARILRAETAGLTALVMALALVPEPGTQQGAR